VWNDRTKSNWAILPVSMIVTADTMGVENCVRYEARQAERERERKKWDTEVGCVRDANT